MKKKASRTKAERDAWNAHVDETLRRLGELAEKAWAEIEQKRAADPGAPPNRNPA